MSLLMHYTTWERLEPVPQSKRLIYDDWLLVPEHIWPHEVKIMVWIDNLQSQLHLQEALTQFGSVSLHIEWI